MLIFLGITAAVAIAGVAIALRHALGSLPRSNRDWIFY